MGTLKGWRKAYSALKDITTVGLAKVNSKFKDVDIAVVKATSHVERPPEERHVRRVYAAASGNDISRIDVAYCVRLLARRLAKTRSWVVALKTLIVIHRALREGESIFKEELLYYSHKAHFLAIKNFKDDSSFLAWDCSAWVRTYAHFLEERLQCFKILRYDVETQHSIRYSDVSDLDQSRTKTLSGLELLKQLLAIQQLLFCLVGCQPEGAAFGNYLIQYALALVVKDSFKIYCAMNDAIINLVDLFFEMSRYEAMLALDIYKRASRLALSLSKFYEFCKGLEIMRIFQFPTLKEPTPSFLVAMEEHIRETPPVGSVSTNKMESRQRNFLTYAKQASSDSLQNPIPRNPKSYPVNHEEKPEPIADVAAQPATTGDLLDLHETPLITTEQEDRLVLETYLPGGAARPAPTGGHTENGTGSSRWDFALVGTPSSNYQSIEMKMAGGFDGLPRGSLYDDATRRQQNRAAHGDVISCEAAVDPFAPLPPSHLPQTLQIPLMAEQQQQQQQYYLQQHNIIMMQHQKCQPQISPTWTASSNPLGGDPRTGSPQAAPGSFTLV